MTRSVARTLRRLPLLAALLAASASCTLHARPSIRPAPLDVHLEDDPERAFAALLEVYADLGMPIAAVDGAAHYLEGRQVRYAPAAENGAAFDCGQSAGPWRLWMVWRPRAPRIFVHSRITTVMMPQEDGTHVHHVHQAADESGGEIGCVSTGVLEQRLTDAMRIKLARSAAR